MQDSHARCRSQRATRPPPASHTALAPRISYKCSLARESPRQARGTDLPHSALAVLAVFCMAGCAWAASQCPDATWLPYTDDGVEGHDSCINIYAQSGLTWSTALSLCSSITYGGAAAHLITFRGSSKSTGLAGWLFTNFGSTFATQNYYFGCIQDTSALYRGANWSWVDGTPSANLNCAIGGGSGCNLWTYISANPAASEPNDAYQPPYDEEHREDACCSEGSGINDVSLAGTSWHGGNIMSGYICEYDIPSQSPTPSPTASMTPTVSVTASVTVTATATVTQSGSVSATSTASGSVTGTVSATYSATASATSTLTGSVSATRTATMSSTPTVTATTTATITPSVTPSASDTTTASSTGTVTGTASATITATVTATATPSRTPTATETPTCTPSITPTDSASPSGSATRTSSTTGTSTETASSTVTPSASSSVTSTSSGTDTLSPTSTGTSTITASVTTTATVSCTAPPSPTPSLSTGASPSTSSSVSLSASGSPSSSGTASFTASASALPTSSALPLPSPSLSQTPAVSISATVSSTASLSVTVSPSPSSSSLPVDCEVTAEWSEWSACVPACASQPSGQSWRLRPVTVFPANGGAACPPMADWQQTRPCNASVNTDGGACHDCVRDGAETDVDCGGPSVGGECARCADGLGCLVDTDCGSASVCASSTHTCISKEIQERQAAHSSQLLLWFDLTGVAVVQAAAVEAALLHAILQYWVGRGLNLTGATVGVIQVAPDTQTVGVRDCNQSSSLSVCVSIQVNSSESLSPADFLDNLEALTAAVQEEVFQSAPTLCAVTQSQAGPSSGNPSNGGASLLPSFGVAIIVALCFLVVIICIVGLVLWRRRKTLSTGKVQGSRRSSGSGCVSSLFPGRGEDESRWSNSGAAGLELASLQVPKPHWAGARATANPPSSHVKNPMARPRIPGEVPAVTQDPSPLSSRPGVWSPPGTHGGGGTAASRWRRPQADTDVKRVPVHVQAALSMATSPSAAVSGRAKEGRANLRKHYPSHQPSKFAPLQTRSSVRAVVQGAQAPGVLPPLSVPQRKPATS